MNPMLGNNSPVDFEKVFSKLQPNEYLLGSIKKDGVRLCISDVIVPNNIEATSRTFTSFPCKEFNAEFDLLKNLLAIIKAKIPTTSIIDFEVYIHGLKFPEINAMLSTKSIKSGDYKKGLYKRFDEGVLSKPVDYYLNLPKELEYYIILSDCAAYEESIRLLKHYLAICILRAISSNNESLIKVLKRVTIVEPVRLYNYVQCMEYYRRSLLKGFEGICLFKPDTPYMFKRTTATIGHFLKMKPHKVDKATIIGVNELMLNTNKSFKNARGLSEKRNTKEDKASSGLAGSFVCTLDSNPDIVFNLPLATLTVSSKAHIWQHRSDYLGLKVEVSSMEGNTKSLRQPKLLRIIDDTEES